MMGSYFHTFLLEAYSYVITKYWGLTNKTGRANKISKLFYKDKDMVQMAFNILDYMTACRESSFS